MSNTVKLNTCPQCKAPIPAAAPQGLCPRCVLLGAATATETGVPATATSEIPSLERIAAAFPQLEILELIGRGGMGFVFKARQPHLDRFVALKLLPDKLAKDALFAERFNREGRVLAKLNHPNITSVFDFGHASATSPAGAPSETPDPRPNPHPGFYYLLMEYVDGVNLRQAMRAGRFSPAEALALVPKVCEALQYAHEQGILHRDIKPENILLDTKGRVKIADFGIAKLVGEDLGNVTLTNTGASLGTPHYMAPEQFEKPGTVDHRADIYSLGVVFYEMLTGELPIGRFAAPSSKTPVNSTVDDVVFRTLEKDRERRFQSAGEMRTQVAHLGEGRNAAPPSTEVDQPAPAQPVLPAPAWMKRAGVLFCVLGCLAFVPTVAGIVNGEAIFYSYVFLALTGAALLTGSPSLFGYALFCNALGLVMPLVFLIARTFYGMGDGSMPARMLGITLGPPSVPGIGWLNVLLTFLYMSTFAAGFWALIRLGRSPSLRIDRHQAPSPAHSRLSILGAALVFQSLTLPLVKFVVFLSGQQSSPIVASRIEVALVMLPGLAGTIIGWLVLRRMRASGRQQDGLQRAMFTALAWPLILSVALAFRLTLSLVIDGRMASKHPMLGVLCYLLAPLAIGLAFWMVRATKRWATKENFPQERGMLKWAFILVLLIGMGVVLVTNPGQHRAVPQPPQPIVGGTSVALSSAKTKVVELSLFKNQRNSIFLTTASPLGPDEALVPILERPDGSREMGQFITHFARDNNRTQERATAIWNWEKDKNYPIEEVQRIETLLEENIVGRPLTLVAGQPLHLFSLTNRAGGILRCHLDYQPDFTENTYRSTESDQAMVRVEQGVVSAGSSSTLILFLKPSVPPGHSLQPVCDGTIGSSGSTQRTISQSSGNASFTCNWIFPESFTSNDVFTAQAQCDKLRQSPPFAIPSGGRQLLFAVTNQAGEIHRGYLELTKSKTAPTITYAIEAVPMIQFTFTSVELREEANARWLTMEYVEQVRGDCERTFRYDARVPGFTAQTRMDSAQSDAKAGFAPVVHQRVLWKLPDSLPPAEALALRDLVAKQWMGKSTAIEPGDERVLFKTVVPDGGTLATTIGVKHKHDDASIRVPAEPATEPDEAAEVRIRLAREQFKAAQQIMEAGAGSKQFLAEAERRLMVAEARGDAVAVARANLKFADQALRAAKENFEAGVVSAAALRIAESEQALAELDLKAALKSTKATLK